MEITTAQTATRSISRLVVRNLRLWPNLVRHQADNLAKALGLYPSNWRFKSSQSHYEEENLRRWNGRIRLIEGLQEIYTKESIHTVGTNSRTSSYEKRVVDDILVRETITERGGMVTHLAVD